MIRKIIIFIIMFALTCSTTLAKKSQYNKSEELKNMQTRYYDTSDKESLLLAAVNVLQDSDYVIQNIDFDLGFLQARKLFKSHYVNKKRITGWSAVLAATTAYTVFSYGSTAYSMYEPSRRVLNEMKDKTAVADVNVFVDTISDNITKIRMNVNVKILQNADGYSFVKEAPMRVFRIDTPKIYDEFFLQLENIIFLKES